MKLRVMVGNYGGAKQYRGVHDDDVHGKKGEQKEVAADLGDAQANGRLKRKQRGMEKFCVNDTLPPYLRLKTCGKQ